MPTTAFPDRSPYEESLPPEPPGTSDGGLDPTWLLRRFLALATAAVLVGCGSGAGSALDQAPEVRGRVALAAIDGATVTAYRLGEYEVPLATATSAGGATAAEIGRFTLTLPKLPADAMVLLVASGGRARDVNEDGVLGDERANYSRIHALARAGELERGEVLISAVTDLVYYRVQYFLRALYDDAFVARACDAWASFVLRGNVAGGPQIDNEDALAFDPRLHGGTTFRPYAPRFRDYVETVLADGPTLREQAFALTREEIHFEDLPGESRGVAVVGTRAYLCRGAAGLEIRDVSQPTAAPLLGAHDTPGAATEVQVIGPLAYLADGAGGLRIVNVADPAVPTHVGALVLPWGPVVAVHVVGSLAYVCTAPNAGPVLAIIDVANPASPALLSSHGTDDVPARVRVAGNFAYVQEQNRVEIFDVTNPVQPVYRGVLYRQVNIRADVAGGHLFVADDTRLEIFSLDTPWAPLSVGSCLLPGPGIRGLRVDGTRALLAGGANGLHLVDVADPTAPRLLGTIATSGHAADVAVSGGLGVVSNSRGGLVTVALGTPAPSGVVASVPWTNGIDAVKAVGNRLYAASYLPAELVVLDTTDPLAPVTLGHVPLVSSRALDVDVAGDTVFVAESAGLQAYDVSQPGAPAFLDGVASATPPHGLAAGDGVVYTVHDSQVAVYTAAPPSDLGTSGLLPISGPGERLALDGGVLAVAAGQQGLMLYDATTPTAPVWTGTSPGSYAQDVALHLPYALVSQYLDNRDYQLLQVVDCSDPEAPEPVRDVPFLGMVDRLDVSANLLYASGWVAGVHVLDVAQPERPLPVGTLPVPAGIRDLDVDGNFVYVATRQTNRAVLVLRAAQVGVP